MKNKKAGWPVIVFAFAALAAFLYYMGSIFLAEPKSVHTAPPPWIDAVTGKLKAPGGGSGSPKGDNGANSPQSAYMKGRSGQ